MQGLHLHNCLYDSGASHSLMLLAVMEKLGLYITRPYKYLYSFDSKIVQCLGMIKDMVVRMVQIPRKFVMMDVVINGVPPTYGMLLSIHWGTSVGGSIQFDLSFATIPIFGGETHRLYRDKKNDINFV
jgi:hypothetical protein